MDPKIQAELEKELVTPFHKALLDHVKELVELSRGHMSGYYAKWDAADNTYRGLMESDKSDTAAKQRGEPQKMVVPLTYAQTQTFVAFCISLFTQREYVFELVPKGEEDAKAAKVGEELLARDLTSNVFESKLYQMLLDVTRFGVGIIKTAWVEEKEEKEVEVESPMLQMGPFKIGTRKSMVKQMVPSYQGNRLYSISPYRFFPDVRLPISRFQEGEFCASEDEHSIVSLHQKQMEGSVAGIQWVKEYQASDFALKSSTTRRMSSNLPMSATVASTRTTKSQGMAVITEVQVSLIPSKFEIDDKPMGPEDYPIKYVVWYANDTRIIKCEPLGYKHNKFTYDLCEYSPDQHNLLNDGLAGTIDNLQSVISWFINSHITSVRKTIQNFLVVDPAGIEMKDLVERRPVLRLKSEMRGQDIRKFIQQLDVHDVTAGHLDNAMALQSIMQTVTGINDNALGQFHTGRRSATEARNVNSATAARLKMQALLIFRTCLEPMARKMLSNLQDGLTVETYVQVLGEMADPMAMQQFTKVTRDNLVGEYDFEVFDGTLPSERSVQAQTIEEFLVGIMKTPEVVMLFGYDPRKLVEEWLELRGIRNPKRFLLDQVRQQEIQMQLQQMGMQNGQQQPNGQPGVPPGQGSAAPTGGGIPLSLASAGGGPGGQASLPTLGATGA